MGMLNRVCLVFQWLYIGLGIIYHCSMHILINRKCVEVEYWPFMWNASDSIGKTDRNAGQAPTSFPVASNWFRNTIEWCHMYVKPQEILFTNMVACHWLEPDNSGKESKHTGWAVLGVPMAVCWFRNNIVLYTCILTHRKHTEMQYCLSIHQWLHCTGMKYEDVRWANIGIPMAVCWSRAHMVLLNVYIDPLETCWDGIMSFPSQIIG